MIRPGPRTVGRCSLFFPAKFWLAFSLLLVACHPRPVEDLALADVAMKAAVRAKADSLAPDAFRRAENYFLRAKKDFEEGYFESCRKNSDEARRDAEQAEFLALKKQTQIRGDFSPSGNIELPAPPEPEGY